MQYAMDMKEEKKPNRQNTFPDGWHTWKIVSITQQKSKAGNEMFLATLEEHGTGLDLAVYLVAEKGKRWMLKSLLASAGVHPDAEGVFNWDESDIIGKLVSGLIKNEPETWIDREGKEKTTMKSRIIEFKPEENISWDN